MYSTYVPHQPYTIPKKANPLEKSPYSNTIISDVFSFTNWQYVCTHTPPQVGTFTEIVDPHGQSTDEDSYKALTALGLLSAVQTLVKASFNELQVGTFTRIPLEKFSLKQNL